MRNYLCPGGLIAISIAEQRFGNLTDLVILVVEDEPIIRMGIADDLEGLGFQVVEAGNADRALRILSSQERIDILVTDINMPGELDGIDLALWTRLNRPSAKIIVISGAQSESPRLKALGDEGRIFSKPFSSNFCHSA